jgi:hypothetical protein
MFTLFDVQSDVASVAVEVSSDGGTTYSAATLAAGAPEGTTGLATSPGGSTHTFLWDSSADFPFAFVSTAHLRLTASDSATGPAVVSGAFSIDNTQTPPSATVVTPSSLVVGLATLSYSLIDAQSDVCSVTVEYSTDAGATFSPASESTAGGSDGVTGLAASPGTGTAHTFVWDTVVDSVALSGATSVIVRITPADGAIGTAAVTGSFMVNNGAPNTAPTASVSTPSSPSSGMISVGYALIDPDGNLCAILAEYSVDDGATWSTCAEGTGSDGTTALTSSASPGTAHTFVWDSLADVGGITVASTLIRITPSDLDSGVADTTASFSIDNSMLSPPTTSVSTPKSPATGDVSILYTLVDGESDTCSIAVAYSIDGGTTFAAATEAASGSDGTTGLSSSPIGVAHVFVWDSAADLGPTKETSVVVMITPSDAATGTAGTSSTFTVDNEPSPRVTVADVTGEVSGDVAIDYELFDREGDLCSISVMWSVDGGTSFGIATEAATGSDGTSDLTSGTTDPGAAHVFVWDSASDLSGYDGSVIIMITASDADATGPSDSTSSFSLDNNSAPTVTLTDVPTPVTGSMTVTYTLTDAESDS